MSLRVLRYLMIRSKQEESLWCHDRTKTCGRPRIPYGKVTVISQEKKETRSITTKNYTEEGGFNLRIQIQKYCKYKRVLQWWRFPLGSCRKSPSLSNVGSILDPQFILPVWMSCRIRFRSSVLSRVERTFETFIKVILTSLSQLPLETLPFPTLVFTFVLG